MKGRPATGWKVAFVDFPAQFARLEGELMRTIRRTLARGDLVLRSQLRDFEDHLAAFVGTSHAVGVSNCTDGMQLVLRALGIGSGDEVITVAHTFVATVAAIKHTGATPVLVDVGEDHNMEPEAVEAALTSRTRALMPVHLNGRLCRMNALMNLAARVGAVVIEDSAQSLGAAYKGIRGGAWGVAGCFSFYPAKLLGAYGDAGAVTTSDEALADKLRLLRNHGRATQHDLDGWGYNARLDNLQAAILDLKLAYVPSWIERRRELARQYETGLEGVEAVKRPASPDDSGPWFDVFQNYVIEAENRDALKEALESHGVETLVSWPKPLHDQTSLGLGRLSLPNTERLSRKVLSLPLTTELELWQID